VLFTDIVSSTARAAALGDDAWTRTLDRHDDLVAREVERHRGRRINTTGDGMLATFDGPARGVRCAQAICGASLDRCQEGRSPFSHVGALGTNDPAWHRCVGARG
jgi:class 3 adenylate cyclase